MKISNNIKKNVHRRTFLKKITGLAAGIFFLPLSTKLFSFGMDWKNLDNKRKEENILAGIDPFTGEIFMVAFNFAPKGYLLCQGQLLSVSQNPALFNLLGTKYGGNGSTTFGLPDLRGRFPMGWGNGSGLTNRTCGQSGGEKEVTLTQAQYPAHSHTIYCNSGTGNSSTPAGNYYARDPHGTAHYAAAAGNQSTLSIAGNGLPHNNLHPYLMCNFAICLSGIYPFS